MDMQISIRQQTSEAIYHTQTLNMLKDDKFIEKDHFFFAFFAIILLILELLCLLSTCSEDFFDFEDFYDFTDFFGASYFYDFS